MTIKDTQLEVAQSHGVSKGSCNHLPDWVHAKQAFCTNFITSLCNSMGRYSHMFPSCSVGARQRQEGASPQDQSLFSSARQLSSDWLPVLFFSHQQNNSHFVNKTFCLHKLGFHPHYSSGYLTNSSIISEELVDSYDILSKWHWLWHHYYETAWWKLFQLGQFLHLVCQVVWKNAFVSQSSPLRASTKATVVRKSIY